MVLNLLAWQQRRRDLLDAWSDARRILLVRLDSLGDCLLTTPAFRAIKETEPRTELTLVTSPTGAQLAGLVPGLDEVLPYASPLTDPWLEVPHDPAREWRLIDELRQRQFDACIIFTSFRQSPLPAALLCYLAGIPLRLGATDDGAGSLLTTRHHWPDGLYHEVERALNLVGIVGYRTRNPTMRLQLPASARRAAQHRLALAGIDGSRPLVVVHPGCAMPARTYDARRFALAADLLAKELKAQIVVTGSQPEGPLVEQVCSSMRERGLPWVGTSLALTASLIQAADVVVTNNTGPAHIAAAVKTPVVVLFALTNPPEQWRPWQVPQRLLNRPAACGPCYQRVCPRDHFCLNVPPEQVAAAARELLVESRATLKIAEAAP